ncbi:flagellar protein [Paenibacillus piri]|uniref:Flagellar protein n=1 Tax=Paenibacillus piri TaxID=2547395 RepID=A0A4R5KU83_9BACL|nr:flagellar protein [Paenibacillus piri]TDF99276.1 flagellar protein [Paenibacillus piri]
MCALMVANCPGCGKVFQKNLRNLCMDCVKKLEHEYEACYRYLLSNRKAATSDLSHATGVPESTIFSWIKDRRLSAIDYPNLTYPCNSCGGPIRQESLCQPCRNRLTRDIQEMRDKELRRTDGSGFRSLSPRHR